MASSKVTPNINKKSQLVGKDSTDFQEIPKCGILGAGLIAKMAAQLIHNAGFPVAMWARKSHQLNEFKYTGIQTKKNQETVILESDIIFCCIATAEAMDEVIFINAKALSAVSDSKIIVNLSNISQKDSKRMAKITSSVGGFYLEAQLHTWKAHAQMKLTMCSGAVQAFQRVEMFLQIISEKVLFLGTDVGKAPIVNTVIQVAAGPAMIAISESFALAEKSNVHPQDLYNIYKLTNLASAAFLEAAKSISSCEFPNLYPLKFMRKDLERAMDISNLKCLPMNMTVISVEMLKSAQILGYDNQDTSSIYSCNLDDK